MRAIWRRLGRPDAINWTVLAVIVPLQVAGAFIGTNFDMEGRVLLFTACNVAAVLTAVATHMLGRYLLIPRVAEKLRPLATLAVFEAGALFRAYTFEYFMVTLEFLPESQILWRIMGSQTNLFVGAIVVSSLVGMAREFSDKNAILAQSLERLEQSQADIESRVEERKKTLGTSIRQQLTAATDAIRGANLGLDAAHLQSLIDDVVRPLSHQLGRIFTPGTLASQDHPTTRISWSSILRHALGTNPLRPGWTTLWFSIGALQFFALAVGPGFLGPLLVAIALFAGWFFLAKWAWPRLTRSLPLSLRAILLTLIAGSLAVILNTAINLLFGLDLLTIQFLVTEFLWFTIITWAVSLVSGLTGVLKKTSEELQNATDLLKRQLIIDRVYARHFEQGVARVLHGPVQDAIAASLRRIQQLPEGTTLTESEVAKIRQPIEHALTLLDDPDTPTTPVPEGIGQLVDLWSGVVEIDAHLEDNALLALARSPTTSSIVLELTREAVSNAIRHGDADTIDIHITVDSAGHDIHLLVTNDGSPLPDELVEGVGTRLLHDMSLNWERTCTEHQVRVSAAVPLESRRTQVAS